MNFPGGWKTPKLKIEDCPPATAIFMAVASLHPLIESEILVQWASRRFRRRGAEVIGSAIGQARPEHCW